MGETEALLSAHDISKSFFGFKALENVDFTVRKGEIHALLGENGAGKSTLIKVLTGVHRPDAGTIALNGEPVDVRDTLHAQRLGVGTVYQEVNLLPNLSVAENLYIGRQPKRFGLTHAAAMNRMARALLAQYDIDINVRAPLSSFSVAVQQLVAIARAVDMSGSVLILDEPTASLDRHEVQLLFGVMRKLRDRGLGIVFITHFLDQVYAVADRITVLRNGRLVGTHDTGALPRMELVSMMLGRALEAATEHGHRAPPTGGTGRTIEFSAFGLSRSVAPFDLAIAPGEVIGVAGLLGSGRTETARLMFGVDHADSGKATVDGKAVRISSPREAVRLGFGLCPEDRKVDGIIGDLSVRENIALALQARRGWLKPMSSSEQAELAHRLVKALDIRTTDIEKPVKLLSGGNQQKVILARWLATQPRLLILDEPTRGIDVGAHAEIIQLINRLCEEGLALVVISSEIEEIMAYSTRVRVLRDRQHICDLTGEEISAGNIMRTIAVSEGASA
ncbi:MULTISPECIES: sugar ABC transporter ATP-binding protein [Phyllobacteriaceae]|uniref:Sugar ABC transporter ATP-binding protein n=1 Tax=Mesorhizobium hungaricum TaxID=1566387 RepID=A0A1C2DYV5_9HYPH|nr:MULTISPECIES: sugar ABC transporter ATP-binding protein [Mesorhizobium]MBN9234631.1 sugar ABC transporter ATP-binding protein [Mesorhizobium sp.]MDQ0328889.1 simple sugar transport system ATP-binding protein [Mesorhizobium sp. YL-MeA3-2017]OCX19932.1 sugar ABC transporter ATP-binding protein [Mesorhizobium hungaricum]